MQREPLGVSLSPRPGPADLLPPRWLARDRSGRQRIESGIAPPAWRPSLFESRHSGRPCGPSCAQPPARPGSTLAPSRWNWPHVRAGALGNRRSRRRQESARPPPPLLAQVSRAGDVATTAFPTLALSLFGGMVERKVQLVQPDQGPIAGNLPSPGARRQISALISSALRRPWKRSANASALPLRMRPAVGKARESAVRTSRGELVVGHQGDDSEGMGTKRE